MDSFLLPLREFVRVIADLGQRIISRWYIVVLSALVFVAAGVVLGRVSKPQYVSSMTVIAAQNGGGGMSGGLSSVLSSVGSSLSSLGFRSLAGGTSQFRIYLNLYQSTAVAESMLRNPKDVKLIFGDAIDPSTHEYRPGRLTGLKVFLYGLFRLAPPLQPTVGDMQQAIDQRVQISVNGDDPNIATISCTSTDASACPILLLDLHEATESRLSEVSIEDSKKLAKYITDMLPKIDQQEVRTALVELLGNAEKQLAVATLHQSSGAVIVSPPYQAGTPSFPQPVLVIATSAAVGVVFGFALACLLWRSRVEQLAVLRIRRWKDRLAKSVA